MIRKQLTRIKEKRLEKKEKSLSVMPKITNENVAEHREDILSGARKYIYPLQHSKHRIVVLTTTLVVATIMVFFASIVFLLYRQQTSSTFIHQVTKVLPFPIARTGNRFIAYENYLFELRHYIHYYETQQQLSFDTESGRDQLAAYKKRALDDVVNLAYTNHITIYGFIRRIITSRYVVYNIPNLCVKFLNRLSKLNLFLASINCTHCRHKHQ